MPLVPADAPTTRFDLRASHVKRTALSDQTQFGRFLRGAELKLAASLHSVDVGRKGRRRLACVRDFLRSGLLARVVTLRAPGRRAADDCECPSEPQQVRWREVDRINHAYPHTALKPLVPLLLLREKVEPDYLKQTKSLTWGWAGRAQVLNRENVSRKLTLGLAKQRITCISL